jgi:hypothetical protein
MKWEKAKKPSDGSYIKAITDEYDSRLDMIEKQYLLLRAGQIEENVMFLSNWRRFVWRLIRVPREYKSFCLHMNGGRIGKDSFVASEVFGLYNAMQYYGKLAKRLLLMYYKQTNDKEKARLVEKTLEGEMAK